MAYLARVIVYPVKSLDPLSLQTARVLKSGALEGDRLFALLDAEGKYVNGKREARVHRIRSSFDAMTRMLTLSAGNGLRGGSFQVDRDHQRLEECLGEFFGYAVRFMENPLAGFPDDTDSPGPTIISTATLQEVASWFSGISIDQMRARMRANLEIGGVPPFWEDRLYTTAGATLRFRIGDVEFDGVNPCQRCVVPPRDHLTGESDPQFAKHFALKRQQTLPDWAERSRFNHFYRLAINTRVPPGNEGKLLTVGDELRLPAN